MTDRNVFWADDVADEIEARAPDDPVVVKGGVSPSGIPHVGHANEILRGYFVAEVLRERGHEVRQVFTSDDRDPLRAVPRTLADLEGDLVDLGDVADPGALGRNLGRPYTDVPDPFGCCDSYGDHFTALLARSADLLGVPVEIRSTTDLYEAGAFDEVTRHLLEHREAARDVLAGYQDKVDADYVPFNPVCGNCGKITETVTAVDPAAGTVEYECTDLEAGGRVIEGCGHRGTATLREGKLPWRFEWPAQWAILDVDFEPFGKDHAEGSWPSGVEVARTVLGVEPPVDLVYEWFTLDGEPLSSSTGNVLLVSEVLEMVEPEVFRYFFSKDPHRGRDFSVERLDLLVGEFDRFERVYYGELDDEDARERAGRVYPLVAGTVKTDAASGRQYQHLDLEVSLGAALTFARHLRASNQHVRTRTEFGVGRGRSGPSPGPQRELFDPWLAVAEALGPGDLLVSTDERPAGEGGDDERRDDDRPAGEGGDDERRDDDRPAGEGDDYRDDERSAEEDAAEEPATEEGGPGTRFGAAPDGPPATDYRWDPAATRRLRRILLDEAFDRRVRLPYTFAAVVGMTDDRDLRERWARQQGHLSEDAPEWAVAAAMDRVERARAWARRTDNQYNFSVAADLPDVALDDETAAALDELADFVAGGDHDGEAIQGEIYETARRHGLDAGDLFGAGYRLVLDDDRGPKLGPLLAQLDRGFVVRRLRREG